MCLDAFQLMAPQTLEGARPLVERPDRFGIRSIEHPAAFATHIDEAYIFQDAKMFRDRGLLQAQGHPDVPDRALLKREIVQYLSPAGVGDSAERVRGGRCARHERTIHSYIGICQGAIFSAGSLFLPKLSWPPTSEVSLTPCP